jgi:hypothetical protein
MVSVFHVDQHRNELMARVDPDRHPLTVELYSRIRTMGIQSVMISWLSMPFEESMAQNRAWFREETELAIDRIRSLPADRPILVDSTHVLPEIAADLGVADRAFFLLATPETIRRHNRLRHAEGPQVGFVWPADLIEKQERSFIDRTRYIQETADRLGCASMTVNGSLTPEFVAQHVIGQFGF